MARTSMDDHSGPDRVNTESRLAIGTGCIRLAYVPSVVS